MNRLRAALSNLGAYLTSNAKDVVRNLSLVPTYLGHLLWLISQEYRELAERGYKGNAAVYACVRILVTSIPEPPLVAYTVKADDGEPADALGYAHPLQQLIRKPNPFLTEFEFWELTTLHMVIRGISHWWKERNFDGSVRALWPLRPDRVGPIYGNAAEGEPPIIGWSYLVPGTAQHLGLPYTDVLTFNFPDPMGESGGLAEGFGPMQALASEISADNEATSYVGSLISNYAQPGIIITSQDPITDANDARIIKAQFKQDFGGPRRGEPIVIDNATSITAMGFSLQQLEFPQLRRVAEARIAAAFGVPAVLVGLLVGLESGIRATIEEQRAHFAETTCASYWRRYADQFTNDVAGEFGAGIVCRFDLTKVRALASQALAQMDRIASAYTTGAVLIDEYREALGMAPLANGAGQVLATGIAQGRGSETYLAPGDEPAVAPAGETQTSAAQPSAA